MTQTDLKVNCTRLQIITIDEDFPIIREFCDSKENNTIYKFNSRTEFSTITKHFYGSMTIDKFNNVNSMEHMNEDMLLCLGGWSKSNELRFKMYLDELNKIINQC